MTVSKALQYSSGYKPFIDGLRALSILAVVAYHVGFSQVPGGFVGVDIFFVISGFLIVTHLISSMEAKKFTFGEFWARRALRILPPYLLVIATCAVIAPFVLVLPDELESFGRQVTNSAVMIANHFFLRSQGYFDTEVDVKPLLHMWSLSVEEQFYIIAPLAIFGIYTACRKLSSTKARALCISAILVLFGLSLYGCITLTGGGAGRNYAFFLMPLRAWEFIAGGVIAFLVPFVLRFPRAATEIIALFGLTLVATAIFMYSGEDTYPSWKAIMPVAGAALIILCGVAQPQNLVARALSLKPLVAIGLISYAWYLWHWPLLSFGRIYHFGARDLSFDLAMAGISLLLAWATYLLVDKKILAWRQHLPSGANWKHTGAALSLCIAVGLSGVYMTKVYAPSVASNYTEAQAPKRASRAGVCNLHSITDPQACLDLAAEKPIGLLIGDSHADAAYRGIAKHALADDAVIASVSSGGCGAFFNTHINDPDEAMGERCEKGRANAKSLIGDEIKPKFAVIFSRWSLYTGRGQYSLSEPGSITPFTDTRAGFVEKLKGTYNYLRAQGIDRILVIGPVPVFNAPAKDCVMRSDRYRVERDIHCSEERIAVDTARKDALSWLRESVAQEPNIRFIDPITQFCDEKLCRGYGEEGLLYADTSHISDAGMERIYQAEKKSFEWVFGKDL